MSNPQQDISERLEALEAEQVNINKSLAELHGDIKILLEIEAAKQDADEIIIKPGTKIKIIIMNEKKRAISFKEKLAKCCNCVCTGNNIDISPRLSVT